MRTVIGFHNFMTNHFDEAFEEADNEEGQCERNF